MRKERRSKLFADVRFAVIAIIAAVILAYSVTDIIEYFYR